MNLYPTFTCIRYFATDEFSNLRLQALRHDLWARLTGKSNRLSVFPGLAEVGMANKIFAGCIEIPLEKITGTFDRNQDFDRQFRPLKKHLIERWVNVYLSRENWPPIVVHKVGESYYVEDGHHRVSVARALGMAYLTASVWEYPSKATAPETCPSPAQAGKRSLVSPAHS